MKALTKILMAFVLSLFLVVPAFAIPTLDFGTGSTGPGGLLTLLFGPNVTGANIPLDVLTVADAPGVGIYDLSGTGPSSSGEDPLNGSAVLALDTRNGTNFITIIGGVPVLGIPNGTILLSGTFSSFTIFQNENILSLNGLGNDTKNPALLIALGLDPNTPFHFFGFTISSDFNELTGTGTVISTDITNSGGKVPEPISLILLGSGLAGAGLYRRFRKPKG